MTGTHATCKNHECEKKDECVRYMIQGNVEVEYKWICNEKNRYHWFWEMEKNIIVKQEEQNDQSSEEGQ